ncbi:MAG TPA: hypothetical protein PLL66_08675 [Bacteroidales bacterium]|nr:hypothetical protein [Bacteroidales bacterium]
MKKLVLLSALFICLSSVVFAQKTQKIYNSAGDAVLKVSVPSDKWNVTNEDGLFSLVPNDSGETSRLITMVWASTDPTSETAMDDLVNEAFDVVESLLVDIEWAEEISDFESNGISYVANDGYGYYVNEDGSKDKMSTTVMILIPDDTNIFTLVFFGTADAYDKWEEGLLEIILSIAPNN